MSLPRYQRYKDSGVEWLGEVPEHWRVAQLKHILDLQNGADHKPIEVDAGVPVYGSGGAFACASRAMYDGEVVLLGRKGTVDRPLYVNGPFWAVDTMYWAKIRPGTVGRFAYYLALTFPFDMHSTDTALPSMTKRSYNSHAVALPTEAEQRVIARFLDLETAKLDALIAEQRRLTELLNEKQKAVISHAVTKGLNPGAPMKPSGIEWLGDVPAHWDVMALAHRFDVQLGKMLDSASITGEDLRPYLRVADVQWGAINTEELPMMDFSEDARRKFNLESGDLLVNEGGSYPGRSAIWLGQLNECYYQKALHRIRPKDKQRDSSRFLFYVMQWAAGRGVFTAGGNEATIEHLPAEKLRRYRFAFPPIEEQNSIAEVMDIENGRVSELTTHAENAVAILAERRSALISAAVTGQIDVQGAAGRTSS